MSTQFRESLPYIDVEQLSAEDRARMAALLGGLAASGNKTVLSEDEAIVAQEDTTEADLLARLAILDEIDRCSTDFTGTSPRALLGLKAQRLCTKFLKKMEPANFPMATTIGPEEEPKQHSWRGYMVARAWPPNAVQGDVSLDVYLTQDGRLRTGVGGTVPMGYGVSTGMIDSYRTSQALVRQFVEIPLGERLDHIAKETTMARALPDQTITL
ncbi:MAG: hypothetical protein ACREGG_00580 [Candidatus Saccharimonadales bacterium]